MSLTPKQNYVLDNINRVRLWPYKFENVRRKPRYELDGWECTQQITGLSVQQQVIKQPNGRIERKTLPNANASKLSASSVRP